jgi:parvulin-like peptidyl-prolyl cis-trans isomerase-like protein
VKALQKYYAQLVKQRVQIDEKLLKKINYDAKKPGLKALEKDQRVVARFKDGSKSITVAELTAALEEQFHHGIENAIKSKKANTLKSTTFDLLVSRRIIPAAARERGLDRTPAYNKAVEEYTNSILFAQFVDKAIAPGIQVTDDSVTKYYEQHKAEFTLPAFYKLDALGFSSVKDAQAALNKLRSGTDLKWLRANADNQIKEEAAELKLGGTTVSANALPPELRSQLAGAKKGDYRLFTTAGGQSYAISVLEVTPPEVQPLAENRDAIKKRLLAEHAVAAIQEWAAKIRQARPVKVYLTKIGN